MRIEELMVVCTKAAANLVAREGFPVKPTVVLPLAGATKVIALDGFGEDDAKRRELLATFANEQVRAENAPCYGFVSGAVAEVDGELADVVMVVCGARNHHPKVTAAAVADGGVGEFAEPEDLTLDTMPFLIPLQQAVDAAHPPDVMPTDKE